MAQPLILPPLRPPSSTRQVDDLSTKPPALPEPMTSIAPHMTGLRTDEEFSSYMNQNKSGPPVVIEFGSTWCQKCHEIFPTFFSLSKRYNQLRYAVAQVDYMKESIKVGGRSIIALMRGIRYSPTFAIYKGSRRVDAVLGKDPQKLEDHLWLHCDEC